MPITDSISALFLAGTLTGLILMSTILVSRKFANLILVSITLALIAGIAVEGPVGMLNWLEYFIANLLNAGAFLAGLSLGKVLSATLMSVARSHDKP